MAEDVPRYRLPAQIFHWVTAVCVLTAIPLGFMMLEAEPGPRQNQLYDLHRSFGALIMVLVWGRIAWRFYAPPPPMIDMPAWQNRAARVVHTTLYILLFVLPILGWVGTSAFGARISVFGLFDLPMIVEKNEALSKILLPVHGALGFMLTVLVIGHVGAALYHHVVRKDATLRRMIPKI